MSSMPSNVPRAPTRLWNRSFALASLAFLVTMFGTTLPTPLYPIYQHQFALSVLMITIIYAVYAAGTIAALIIAGGWSDQIGRRFIMFAALAFSAASAIVFVFDANLAKLLLARVLSGISAGLVTGTGTVMVIELAPDQRRHIATLIATAVNMGGLGLGPLIGGFFAEYAPLPTHLIFIVDLVLIAIVAGGLLATRETVDITRHPRLRPQQLGVPQQVRGVFVPAAIAGFAGFAVLGLFTAVAPAFVGKVLGISNLAITGIVVFVIFASSTLGQLALEVTPHRLALPGGCVLLAAGALLVAASIHVESFAVLVAGAVVAGFGQGLGFRAGLGAVTAASPAGQRSEVTSTFFVVLYVAISIPVIGVGIAADTLGLRRAGIGFAIAVAILSLIALLALAFHRRSQRTANA